MVSKVSESYLKSFQDGEVIKDSSNTSQATQSTVVHSGDKLSLDQNNKKIYKNNSNGSKQEMGSLALNTAIIQKFEQLDTQKISDQEYLYAETNLTKKPYHTILNLRNSKTGDIIKTIQDWYYGGGADKGTGKINFLTYNTSNQKAYFIMDMPQGSDYNWYPLLNYNVKTGQLEGNNKSGSVVLGHSKLDLPIYLSPTAKKLIYEEESTVTYGHLKIEGLGVNLAHNITNKSLGLGSQQTVDFRCLTWTTDESKIMFKAVQVITASNKKDLGYFIYDLNSKEIAPIDNPGGIYLGK